MNENVALKKTLTPLNLWAIGVGIVISGQYFGWNFGLAQSGYVGMLIATAIIGVMYVTMCLAIAELSTIMPHAGGPYAFARRALGPYAGFITGIGVILQFGVASAVVASGAGYYVNFLIPEISPVLAGAVLYIFFFIVHVLGIKEYANIEMVLVTIAVSMIIIFSVYGLPHIDSTNLFGGSMSQLIPGGFSGVWAALPYAMWLYLAVEMLPMLSEESKNPIKDMPKAIMRTIITLIVLSVFVVTVTVGLGGIEAITTASDPLALAISTVFGENHWAVPGLFIVGLLALISSLSGAILGYSRQIFSLSRAGYFPKYLANVHSSRRTPYNAIIIPGVIGFILTLLFNPNTLILISTFGALVSYIFMCLSLIVLRIKEPELNRPYKSPWFPIAPVTSIIIACAALFSSVFSNITFFYVSIAIFSAASLYYYLWGKNNINKEAPEEKFSQSIPLLNSELQVKEKDFILNPEKTSN